MSYIPSSPRDEDGGERSGGQKAKLDGPMGVLAGHIAILQQTLLEMRCILGESSCIKMFPFRVLKSVLGEPQWATSIWVNELHLLGGKGGGYGLCLEQ